MPLAGLEILVVGIIILGLVLFGPSKLPELARSIGLAKKEFRKTNEE